MVSKNDETPFDGPQDSSEAATIFARFISEYEKTDERAFEGLCAENPGLAPELRRLFSAYRLIGHRPEGEEGESTRLEAPRKRMGSGRLPLSDWIEGYEVLDYLSEGSFGEVYLAEQREPLQRRVALKLVKGDKDSAQVLSRFELERQTLAMMDHPNIAKIHDAGVTSLGRSYFAMEYVRGVAITEHCDRHRLSIQERIELFLQLCDAVQHAHQRGVIHRDLKPSNILTQIVDDKSFVKVIDFGVAKALNRPLSSRFAFTAHGAPVGTPAYMSPEQAENTPQEIDTRSDIYSMGVVLYQLLTGSLPIDETACHGNESFLAAIRNREFPRPSTRVSSSARESGEKASEFANRRSATVPSLARTIQGDLDWITMKCLEKDRTRRYASTSELAADIRRYQRDEPVLAGPPSTWYRLRKLARRRRVTLGVSAFVLVTVGLAAFAIVRSELERVRLAQQKAQIEEEKRRTDAEELLLESQMTLWDSPQDSEKLLSESKKADPTFVEADIESIIRLMLSDDRASALEETRDALKKHPTVAEFHFVLAELVEDDAERERLLTQGERLLDGMRPESRGRAKFIRALTAPKGSAQRLSLLNSSLDTFPWSFEVLWQRAVCLYAREAFEEVIADSDVLIRIRPELALSWRLRGAAYFEMGEECGFSDAAVEFYEKALGAFEREVKVGSRDPLVYFNRAMSRACKALMQFSGSGGSLPEELLRELDLAVDDFELELERHPGSHQVMNRHRDLLIDIGGIFEGQGNYDRASQSYERALRRHSEDEELLYLAGLNAWKMGDRETARQRLKEVSSTPSYCWAFLHRWSMAKEIGDDEGAARILEDADVFLGDESWDGHDSVDHELFGILVGLFDGAVVVEDVLAFLQGDGIDNLDRATAHYYIGVHALLSLDDGVSAEREFGRVIEIGARGIDEELAHFRRQKLAGR